MNGKKAEMPGTEAFKPDIRLIPEKEIENFFAERNKPRFHARQVIEWLWKKHCSSFAEMSNLSRQVREELEDHFSFPVIYADAVQKSKDGTLKTGFRLSDGNITEGVLIPSGSRNTVCISSQSGCPLACAFCATGRLGYFRNLTAGEIFDQVVYFTRIIQGKKESGSGMQDPGSSIQHPASSIQHPTAAMLSNVVFMGMGEPLLNYDQVKLAIEKITSPEGLGMSPQRITLSTVGIPDMIRKMADDAPKYQVALSLHTANNEKRSRIVPVNKKYPVESLSEAMKYYYKVTHRRFTIEFILFRDFNDSAEDARELSKFCRSFPVKINLIEYNPVEGSPFRKPEPAKVTAFREFLESRNMVVNVRKSRGSDIDAACGQLAANFLHIK